MALTAKGSFILTALIVGVVGYGGWKWWGKFDAKPQSAPTVATVTVNDGSAPAAKPGEAKPDVTTKLLFATVHGTNEAKVVDSAAVPPAVIKPNYKKVTKNGKMLVNIPINVWPGWSSLLMANNGLEANDESVFYKNYGFYVEIMIVDDPVRNRDLFASGENPVMWGTLDMFALFAPELCKDSRSAPRIPVQLDFSDGGDGIVARNGINSINDLRPVNGVKRRIVLAQNSPSHAFVLSLLRDIGVSPTEISWHWAADAMAAAKLFVMDKSFDAFVGWAPDIYTIADMVAGTKLVLTTSSANRRIADVLGFRADFVQENPAIVDAIVDGILQGIEMVRKDPPRAAAIMAKAYGLPVDDALAMIGKDGGIADGDAHLTNYRENAKFFLDGRNPSNFETIWDSACYVYKSVNALDKAVPASKVKYTKSIQNLMEKWKDSVDMSQTEFKPEDIAKAIEIESGAALTKAVQIQFAPNSFKVDASYDTNIIETAKSIGELVGSFGAAAIVIEGNVDSSRKGVVPEDVVRDFSHKRANAVRTHILSIYTNFNPQMFQVKGNGWGNPLPGMSDPTNPDHNRANRRVEVKVFPIEG